jgi:hypothetical protein
VDDHEGIDMSEFTYTGDFGELRMEREMIEVTSNLPRPDRNWTYTDQQGHEHRYDDGWPTLVTVVDRVYWCEGCNDEHQDTHLACAICGEEISPGMVGPSLHREFIPGRMSATLNGDPISKERYEELVATIQGGTT